MKEIRESAMYFIKIRRERQIVVNFKIKNTAFYCYKQSATYTTKNDVR